MANFTTQTKSASVFTGQAKSSAPTFANATKNSASFSIVDKLVLLLQEMGDFLLMENGDFILVRGVSDYGFANPSKNNSSFTNLTKN